MHHKRKKYITFVITCLPIKFETAVNVPVSPPPNLQRKYPYRLAPFITNAIRTTTYI